MAGVFLALGLLMLVWRKGPNCWIGVRLPWTFADRQIWDKSWRLSAMFLTGMGVGALVSWKIFLISLAHLVILGMLYPVYLYRRKYGTLRYWREGGGLSFHPMACCPECGEVQKLQDAEELPGLKCARCGYLRPRN